jgi:hypothetical protein
MKYKIFYHKGSSLENKGIPIINQDTGIPTYETMNINPLNIDIINRDIWEFLFKINNSINNFWLQMRIEKDKPKLDILNKDEAESYEIYEDIKYKLVSNDKIKNLIENANQVYDNLYGQKNYNEEVAIKENYLMKMKVNQNCKVAFFGDYHSSLHSLAECLLDLRYNDFFINENSWILKDDKFIIFTGDLVDRGPYGIECLYLVYQLFILNNQNEKNKVVILNGNHEEKDVYSKYQFKLELINQINSDNFEPEPEAEIDYDWEEEDDNEELKKSFERETQLFYLKKNIDVLAEKIQNSTITQDEKETYNKLLEEKKTIEDEKEEEEKEKKIQEYEMELENKYNLGLKSRSIMSEFESLIERLPLALFLKYENENSWHQFCHGAIDEIIQIRDVNQLLDFLNDENSNTLTIPYNVGKGFLWNDMTNDKINEIIKENFNLSEFNIFDHINDQKKMLDVLKDLKDNYNDKYNFYDKYKKNSKCIRRTVFKDILEVILNKSNVKLLISGHQDLANLGLIIKDGHIDNPKYSDHKDYVHIFKNELYNYEFDSHLKTMTELNNISANINFFIESEDMLFDNTTRSLNLNTNELQGITLSSAVITRHVPFSMYGILDSNSNITIKYFRSCSTYLWVENGKYNNKNSVHLCDKQIKGHNLIEQYMSRQL